MLVRKAGASIGWRLGWIKARYTDLRPEAHFLRLHGCDTLDRARAQARNKEINSSPTIRRHREH
jgi:hypothetical protein